MLDWVIGDLDLILIMSVNPGFGGQSFIDASLRKIEAVRRRITASGKDIRLEVDGGIKVDNIRRVADAEAFVAGSAIIGQADYKAVVVAMRAALGRVACQHGGLSLTVYGACLRPQRSGTGCSPLAAYWRLKYKG